MARKRGICSKDTCDEQTKAKGLCHVHYNNWLRHNNRPCSMNGCGGGVVGQDLCSKHLQRKLRHGDPSIVLVNCYDYVTDGEAFFFNQIEQTPDANGCLVWKGLLNNFGYGVLRYKHTPTLSHRLAWELANGRKPQLHVLHSCDNPPCYNPAHLREGTQSENMLESWQRTRRLKPGKWNNMSGAKLTSDQVLAIRADKRIHRLVAQDYSVDSTTISMIKLRKTWRHL